MRGPRRFQALLSFIVLLFLYLITTVVAPRFAETFEQYRSLSQLQSELLDPSVAAKQMEDLAGRRDSLNSLLTSNERKFDQNTTGVVQLLTQTAKASQVHVESLHPTGVGREGQFENIGFRLGLASRFHEIGSYVNALETSEIPIEISKIDINVQSMRASSVRADVEGVARIVSRVRME